MDTINARTQHVHDAQRRCGVRSRVLCGRSLVSMIGHRQARPRSRPRPRVKILLSSEFSAPVSGKDGRFIEIREPNVDLFVRIRTPPAHCDGPRRRRLPVPHSSSVAALRVVLRARQASQAAFLSSLRAAREQAWQTANTASQDPPPAPARAQPDAATCKTHDTPHFPFR